MNKKGVFKTITIIFVVLILLLAAIAAYFYYFHTFRFFKACVSDKENNTNVVCIDSEECRQIFLNESNISLEEMPQLLREELILILEEAVYCDSTCKVKEMYGDSFGQPVETCNPGDREFVVEIKGKDMLKLFNYYKENIGDFGKELIG